MKQVGCKTCDYNKYAGEGICSRKKASDGLALRCVGGWSKEKHFYLQRYIDIFVTSMRKKWSSLNYIDLFAGPGRCLVRDYEEEIDGSPLIALNSKYPFTNYFFVDINEENIKVLKDRSRSSYHYERIEFILIEFILGDCNEKMDEIIKKINPSSLSLAFIDPTGLQFRFSTLENLAKSRKVDLIITFPQGMAIKRNIHKFLTKEWSLLDDFLGDTTWREWYNKLKHKGDPKIERAFIERYRDKLTNIGYKEAVLGDEVLIKSTQKHLPLYYLIFASKHPLGQKFWKEITKVESSGQRKLF